MPSRGRLAAIKLVHLYGYVSCNTNGDSNSWSYWGCGYSSGSLKDKVNVVITASSNHIILPPNQLIVTESLAAGKWYYNVGYSSLSPELVLSVFSDPLLVSSGQEFRVCYGEDLVNYYDHDNGGKVCSDVYALYV